MPPGFWRDGNRVSVPEVVANPNIYLKEVFQKCVSSLSSLLSSPTKLHLSDKDVYMHGI